MKPLTPWACALVLLAAPLCLHADDPSPAYVDFGKFSPPSGRGEFVEVQINKNIISMVARLAEKSEPEVAKLVRGLELIHVHVIGLNADNRSEIEQRVKAIRSKLEAQKWEGVVTAREGDQDVRVYLKTRGDEAVEGLAVLVLDAKREAVFVNLVGDIRPEQLAVIGERFNIEPLKELGKKISKK